MRSLSTARVLFEFVVLPRFLRFLCFFSQGAGRATGPGFAAANNRTWPMLAELEFRLIHRKSTGLCFGQPLSESSSIFR
jgi:hypothetical protein